MQVEPARFAEAGIVRLPKPWPQAYDPVRGWSVRAAQTKPETEAIVKNGFKVMDSDLHTMEPDGLWERYLAEPFKKFASRFLRSTDNAPNQPLIKIGDLEIGEMSRTAVVGKDLHHRSFARHPHYEVAHACSWGGSGRWRGVMAGEGGNAENGRSVNWDFVAPTLDAARRPRTSDASGPTSPPTATGPRAAPSSPSRERTPPPRAARRCDTDSCP